MGKKSHSHTDHLVVSRPLLLYPGYGIHSHYGFAKKKLIPASLTEIIQSIYITFLSVVPRFSDEMFRLKCVGLRHVVRAMLTANVKSQKLKREKLRILPTLFSRIILLKISIFTVSGLLLLALIQSVPTARVFLAKIQRVLSRFDQKQD